MRVPFDEMKSVIKDVFMKYGLDERKAEICARVHTETSRDGVFSHGTNRVPRFADYLKKGWVKPEGKPVQVRSFGAMAVYDGGLGPGITNAFEAADRAMELADRFGIGLVGLKNTTHWMRGGTYGLYAAEKGYVFIGWTNTESCMPPWGGTEPRLGNNPLVMAAPSDDAPILLDMAMSQYSYGKLQVTRLAGKKLPYPGGFDKDGNLTDEPGLIEESLRILPAGYWKGSSLAFMLDILGAALSDGLGAAEIDRLGLGSCGGCSQIFIAIDPGKLTSADHMFEIFREAKAYIKSSAEAENMGGIRAPGEGVARAREASEQGVWVDDTVWAEILSLLD